MKPIFLSYYISEATPLYGGAKDVISFKSKSSIQKGDTANSLSLNLPNHACTHIDFPFHFNDLGKKCSDYPAEFWIFNRVGFLFCKVEDILTSISSLPGDIELLVLKTGFGQHRNSDIYWSSQPVIPATLANDLKMAFPQLRVFGFDLISLTSKLDRPEGRKAHNSFLIENDILVLEDMNLEALESTPSTVIISPLLIDEADGSPCTVIAY